MTTVATTQLRTLAAEWEEKCGLTSAVFSGIVGDQSHAAKGGYHISRADNPAGNYSVIRPDDRGGPSDAASAVDMTMNPADMKKCTNRLVAAYTSSTDPRRKYLNAFNGWTGTGTPKRWDVYARTITEASLDHKWHVHIEIRRKYSASAVAVKAIVSILRGESVAAYLRSIGVVTSTTTKVPPYPGTPMRRNDGQSTPDPGVKMFQSRMLTRGWTSLGSADGFFGAKLESVVKRWQTTCGLAPVDGVIGPKTWPTPWTRPLGK